MKQTTLSFLLAFILASCTHESKYLVNCTFNHQDVINGKSYKSQPIDLYVMASSINELEKAVKKTLSDQYLLYSVSDIDIIKYEIVTDPAKKETTTINDNYTSDISFNINDLDEIYGYIDSFDKTYIFNGILSKTYNNYSPTRYLNSNYGTVYLTIKNRKVRLVNQQNQLLLTFDILSPKAIQERINLNNKITKGNVNNVISNFIGGYATAYAYKFNNGYMPNSPNINVEGYVLSIVGKNNFANEINISFEFNYHTMFGEKANIYDITINYHIKDVRYSWICTQK